MYWNQQACDRQFSFVLQTRGDGLDGDSAGKLEDDLMIELAVVVPFHCTQITADIARIGRLCQHCSDRRTRHGWHRDGSSRGQRPIRLPTSPLAQRRSLIPASAQHEDLAGIVFVRDKGALSKIASSISSTEICWICAFMDSIIPFIQFTTECIEIDSMTS
jgi:hypothetical protein